MILANHTDRDRTIFLNDIPYCIPAMGFKSFPEDVATQEALNTFMNTEIGKRMFDMGVFSFDPPKHNEMPVKIQGPTPPEELLAPSNNTRVTTGSPTLTGETVKV